MRSLTVRASFSSRPPMRSWVTPWTNTRQEVTESGTVNSTAAEPSAPVRRCGCQKAVSEKFERRGTAASWPASVSLFLGRLVLPGLLDRARHVHYGALFLGQARRRGHPLGPHPADDAPDHAAPDPRAADAVAAEVHEPGGPEGRKAGDLDPARILGEGLGREAERGVPGGGSRARRIKAHHVRRMMRSEKVEAPVVHVGQELGGALERRLPAGQPDRDAPGFLAARRQLVPERGERQLELLVVPGHEHARFLGHELVIPERREARPESAPEVLRDGDLQDARVPSRVEPAALPDLARRGRSRKGRAGRTSRCAGTGGPSRLRSRMTARRPGRAAGGLRSLCRRRRSPGSRGRRRRSRPSFRREGGRPRRREAAP